MKTAESLSSRHQNSKQANTLKAKLIIKTNYLYMFCLLV